MMKLSFKDVIAALIMGSLFFACGGSEEKESSLTEEQPSDTVADTDTTDKEKEKKAEPINAIALWKSSIYKNPTGENKKWLASYVFGEQVKWLGDSMVSESDNRTYIKIKLADGKVGWANQYLFAVDAYRAVVTNAAPLYTKPDPLTITDDALEPGTIVAVKNKGVDSWKYIMGKEKKVTGWIQGEKNLSTDQTDLVVAVQMKKALKTEDPEARLSKINDILENPNYSSSAFYDFLLKKKSELLDEELNIEDPLQDNQDGESDTEPVEEPVDDYDF